LKSVATIRDEKGVLTVSGKSEEAVAEAVAHLHRQELREAARRERWGEGGAEGMQRLCRLFPTLRGVPGTDPWEWDKLLEWLTGPAPTSGSTWAALFVLGVWNPTTDWSDMAQELPLRPCRRCDGAKRLNDDGDPDLQGSRTCTACQGAGKLRPSLSAGKFDLFRAMSTWDREHVDAAMQWIELPFWP
jgi:hypothetical protein